MVTIKLFLFLAFLSVFALPQEISLSEILELFISQPQLYIGDFNGDKADDIIIKGESVTGGTDAGLYLSVSNGSFIKVEPFKNFSDIVGSSADLYIGDFNGDELDDFLTINTSIEAQFNPYSFDLLTHHTDGSIFFSNGNGTFRTSAFSPFLYVGYFNSWLEKVNSNAQDLDLANLPKYVKVVNIGFMKPDAEYYGNLNFSGTGLSFLVDGAVLKAAIATLKSRNPETKVLVSVGGSSYLNWAQLNELAIANFVADFGLDGVDLAYILTDPSCTSSKNGQVKCLTDQEYQNRIARIRLALPRPYKLSLLAYGVGAYGEGDYYEEQPQGQYTGVTLNLLRSSAAEDLDLINIAAYNVGLGFNSTNALKAYKSYFSGKVILGVAVSPKLRSNRGLTLSDVESLARSVKSNGDGLMIMSLNTKPVGNVSSENPDANLISQAVCRIFNLPECNILLNL